MDRSELTSPDQTPDIDLHHAAQSAGSLLHESDYKLPEKPEDVELVLAETRHDRRRLEALAEREKSATEQYRYKATHDELTGLLNRRGLEEFLESRPSPQAILYLDSTNLKRLNDELGHDAGDRAITGTAAVITNSLREGSVAARIGGDEFLVVLGEENKGTSAPGERLGKSEERRSGGQGSTPEEKLEAVEKRIKIETQKFLFEHPDLQEKGFDIAVGGAIWQEGMSVDQLRVIAEEAMGEDKDVQHEAHGKYR